MRPPFARATPINIGKHSVPFLLATLVFAIGAAQSAEFFVSPKGRDEWSGSRADPAASDGPFATIERAQRAARRARVDEPGAAVRVTLRGGTYRVERTIEFGAADSGTSEAPVMYSAAAGELVIFTGGREIRPEAFQPVTDSVILQRLPDNARGRVLQADLRANGIANYGVPQPRGQGRPTVNPAMELFCNNQPLPVARWPNRGMVKRGAVIDKGGAPRYEDFSNRGGTFTFDYDRPSRWTKAKDIWLSGYFARGYAPDTIEVKSIDLEKRTISLARPHRYGLETVGPTQEYFALNLLEEIDEAGEWYLDRDQGLLFLWPPQDFAAAKLAVSLLDEPLMALEGVSHLTLRGLTFEVSRGMGLYLERGEGNRIAGCTFRNLGTVAIALGQGIKVDPGGLILYHLQNGADRGEIVPYEPASRTLNSALYNDPAWNRHSGTRHQITGCNISNTGAGGIILGGGDRKSLTPGDNSIVNCHLHHTGRLDGRAPAISIDGVGNRVEHCLMHHIPLSAVTFVGNDHRIEFNQIHTACLPPAHDMGVIYTGRDPSAQGTVIRHNFFHHMGNPDAATYAIYLDDGACGITVDGNVFFQVHGERSLHSWGHDHRVTNNLLIDSRAHMHSPLDNTKWPAYMAEPVRFLWLRQRIDVLQPPWSTHYPNMARLFEKAPDFPRRNFVENNVSVRSGDFGDTGDGRINLVVNEDPGFKNAAAMNFALTPQSFVFTRLPGFRNIAFENMGLRIDEFRAVLPASGFLPTPGPIQTDRAKP